MANEVHLNKEDFDKKIKLFYQHWDQVWSLHELY